MAWKMANNGIEKYADDIQMNDQAVVIFPIFLHN